MGGGSGEELVKITQVVDISLPISLASPSRKGRRFEPWFLFRFPAHMYAWAGFFWPPSIYWSRYVLNSFFLCKSCLILRGYSFHLVYIVTLVDLQRQTQAGVTILGECLFGDVMLIL